MEKNQSSLDELDFAVLACLQKDGRMSFTEIAEQLNVSVGTARTRLNRLIDNGVISIVGRVDPDKVGFGAYAHIAVYIRPATLKEPVARSLAKRPEVSFLASTSGDYDLEVDVMCPSNQHLAEFINEISQIEGVYQAKTTLYLQVYKYAQPALVLSK